MSEKTAPFQAWTPTAVMIDGAFFLKRYPVTYGAGHSASEIANNLFTMCIKHLGEKTELYRIFFYDCGSTLEEGPPSDYWKGD